MSKYLKLAIVIAIASILISGGILLTILRDISFLTDDPNPIDRILSITQISTAISAIFGLIIGSIAIIAVIEADKSEVKAIESFKLDLIALVNLLYCIRNRCLLYTNTTIIDYRIDLFQKEREQLQKFLGSSSGYALHLWVLEKKAIDGLDINTDIASLMDFMTLELESNPQPILNELAIRSHQLIEKLTYIDDKNLKSIYGNIRKIGNGLNSVRTIIETDTFKPLLDDMISERETDKENLPMPTDDYLQKVLNSARIKIGGQSEKMILDLIQKHKDGDKKSLWYFYELIRQLKLDE